MTAPVPEIVLLPPRLQSSRRAGAGRSRGRALAATLLALVFATVVLPVGAERAGAFGVVLQTGLSSSPAGGEFEQVTLSHIRATGAHFVKLTVNWNEIAPATPPPGFDPANPNDPAYNWSVLDGTISNMRAYGLVPILGVVDAPTWGQAPPGAGEESPDPAQLALFAHALVARYSGSDLGLPWVRYIEVWNEPNLSYFLKPQLEGNRQVSVDTYRAMVNDVAEAVHGVRADDVVIAGALFPNGLRRASVAAIAPLEFTRELLCMSAGPHPHRVCNAQVHADVWSAHPYTTGGPSTPPANSDNLWIYNLGALTNLVKAAQRAGTLVSIQPVQTWVTEFSWDTNPPDPKGVPSALEQRWVSETLYKAWRAGYSVFTWYALQDEPIELAPRQAGLYYSCAQGIQCDTPKPVLRSFRFPFVAFPQKVRKALVWGRTAAGKRTTVRVQWLAGKRWKALTSLKTDGNGIFTATRKLPNGANPKSALLRAVADGETSVAFSLRHPPDIIVQPFGS